MTQNNNDNACWCPHCKSEVMGNTDSKRAQDGDLQVCLQCAHILIYKRVATATRPIRQVGGVYQSGGVLKLAYATDDDFLLVKNAPFEITKTRNGRMKFRGLEE